MRLWIFLSACLFIGLNPATAQTTPESTQPIKILVGAPPGGTTDTMARAIAAEQERRSRPVRVTLLILLALIAASLVIALMHLFG